jgi:hypothetical protein
MQQASENIHLAPAAVSAATTCHHLLAAGMRRQPPRYSHNDIQTLDIDNNGSIEVIDP